MRLSCARYLSQFARRQERQLDSDDGEETLYNPDGTFTMFYGPESACGKVANRLNTPGDNWYLGLRVYRPVQEIIDGKYEMPVPTLVKK
jgi:hypothetical protein